MNFGHAFVCVCGQFVQFGGGCGWVQGRIHIGARGNSASPESTIEDEDVDPYKLPINCFMKCSRWRSTTSRHARCLRVALPLFLFS